MQVIKGNAIVIVEKLPDNPETHDLVEMSINMTNEILRNGFIPGSILDTTAHITSYGPIEDIPTKARVMLATGYRLPEKK